jgi:hypothetical protein
VPTKLEIDSLLEDAVWVAERRRQLSSISCLMKFLNQTIARRANQEDGVKGHFVQGRFGCRNLLDEGAILGCSVYIDLNEIRALLAATPEDSENTSAYTRILASIKRQQRVAGRQNFAMLFTQQPNDLDHWLCPVSEHECALLLGPENVESVAASEQALCEMQNSAPDQSLPFNTATVVKKWRHGFLPCGLDEYLEFLDWNARQLIRGKPGVMDSATPPILERLGMTPSFWLKMIENFERWFHTAAGSSEKLMEHAARTGRRWLQGVGPMREAVGQTK